MDDSQLKILMKETVHETLKSIGFNTDDPIQIQQDIAHLRRIRRGSERLSSAIRSTTVGVVLTGLLYGFWEALKLAIGKQ